MDSEDSRFHRCSRKVTTTPRRAARMPPGALDYPWTVYTTKMVITPTGIIMPSKEKN